MNILTFDIEEWFHILDNESTRTQSEWNRYESRIHANTDRLLDLLEQKNQKATFFCLGWVADKYPEIVTRIHEAGHEIGSHSYAHQLAYEQSIEEYREDLVRSVSLLEDITGVRVRVYRAPGFSLTSSNLWVFDVLAECNIEIDCSVFPARRAHGGLSEFGTAEPVVVEHNGMQIKEFPISLYSRFGRNIIFSGGGYFRLCPYWLMRRLMKHSPYVMTYFHPRDFDKDQPVIQELSMARRFKSYCGLGSAFAKLSHLIDEFEFIDIRTADQKNDWSSARRLAI